ncbi:Hypothetical predicted protein [Olea europaea subsp. europaea]|uniref:Uncharacterized protein n=1 Tax=Olea europaea subsp. europaea TaxID=158383 RepID=A0A8S0V3M0_OLEEU|nr:Hypothetical predicted protein [Olea europaea subsp. europaea]
MDIDEIFGDQGGKMSPQRAQSTFGDTTNRVNRVRGMVHFSPGVSKIWKSAIYGKKPRPDGSDQMKFIPYSNFKYFTINLKPVNFPKSDTLREVDDWSIAH